MTASPASPDYIHGQPLQFTQYCNTALSIPSPSQDTLSLNLSHIS